MPQGVKTGQYLSLGLRTHQPTPFEAIDKITDALRNIAALGGAPGAKLHRDQPSAVLKPTMPTRLAYWPSKRSRINASTLVSLGSVSRQANGNSAPKPNIAW